MVYESLSIPVEIDDSVFFEDHRGYFVNSKFSEPIKLRQLSCAINKSIYTFRGFHWQKRCAADTKIVKVIAGRVLDILINVDRESTFFGKKYQFFLSADSPAILVPACYAHGYLTLTKDASLIYAHSGEYDADAQMKMSPFECNVSEDVVKQIKVISDDDSRGVSLEQAYF